MSKEVDSGIKKFFVIFLGFVVVLDVFSVMLFNHSLFYYLSNSINLGTSWSFEYDNILKYSMISRILFFIMLVCFICFIYFINKKVKNNRVIIYPIMFLLFLLIMEFGVLSFFDYCLPFFKNAHTDFMINSGVVTPYIDFLHPFSLQANIIFIILIIVGNMVDNKNRKEKRNLDKTLLQLAIFYIILLISMFILRII